MERVYIDCSREINSLTGRSVKILSSEQNIPRGYRSIIGDMRAYESVKAKVNAAMGLDLLYRQESVKAPRAVPGTLLAERPQPPLGLPARSAREVLNHT